MLNKKVKGTFLKNEPMAKHTSYGIGGPAQAYITPSDQNDLKQILIFTKDNNINTFGNVLQLLIAASFEVQKNTLLNSIDDETNNQPKMPNFKDPNQIARKILLQTRLILI